jgi:rhamnogalacturonyl hydrolase YesR
MYHRGSSSRTVLHRSGGHRITPLPMKALVLLLLLLLAVSLTNVAAATTAPEQLPPRSQVLADGMRAVDYWLNVTGGQQNCRWEDATFMLGLARLQNATGSAELLAREVAYGDRHNWAFCEGREHNPDYQACAATYFEAYMASPPERKNATWLAQTLATYDGEAAAGVAALQDWWSWVDALFMTMNVYGRAGAVTGDQKYFDFMHQVCFWRV